MKLTLDEPRYLRDSVSIISELVNEVTFNIKNDCVELVAMDPANVAMVIFKLLSSAFAEYEVETEKKVCISLESFKQILKRAKPTDRISLVLDEDRNRLNIIFTGDTVRKFNLALLDEQESEQRVPNLDFGVKVETSSLIFNDAIEDMDIVGDSLNLKVGTEKFEISSDGNLSSAKVEISTDQETDIVNSLGEEVSAKYSIEYLKKIIKGARLSNTVILNLGNDYPLKVEYKVLDKLAMSFVLAPRVSND